MRAPFELLLGAAELVLRTVSYFFHIAEQAVALARDAFRVAQQAVRFAGDALEAAGRALGDTLKFAANFAVICDRESCKHPGGGAECWS